MGKSMTVWVSYRFAKLVQDATLTHYSGYSEEEIQPVFKLMIDYLRRPVNHEAFFKKYASKKFLKGEFSRLISSKHILNNVHSFHPDAPVGQEVSPSLP